ncbi:MAG TPA: SGNH/GDSL hydrolase family protein [Chthonomonadaceae bacterium]|nr:SGNH/GDSL hydrolase family protein [Chthonomonadaceae bacterium]
MRNRLNYPTTGALPALLAWLIAAGIALQGPVRAAAADFASTVRLRGALDNSRRAFERTGHGRIAFIGGSITETDGYRVLVGDSLKRRFQATDFSLINAGVSSTCSTTGAFRLDEDVLSRGPIDLLFVEFAVNDDQDARHTRAECIRGMEGIVRHARSRYPNIDIVFVYFVNPEMLKTIQSGRAPLPIEAHEAVAARYGVPSIDVAGEVAAEIASGTLTWESYGGTHPSRAGHALCARMIDSLLDRAWSTSPAPDARPRPHPLPKAPLDPFSYSHGRFIDSARARFAAGAPDRHRQAGPAGQSARPVPGQGDTEAAARPGDKGAEAAVLSAAARTGGWTLGVPDWSRLPGEKRARFTSAVMLCATEPGAALTLEFEGTAIGVYVLAGPEAGIAEASIDGGPYREADLYHEFSRGLHYPRTVLLGAELRPGRHTLALRVSASTTSGGHAIRILQFAAN